MKCEYCNNEHDGVYASGRFCNSHCAKAFSFRIANGENTREIRSLRMKEKWKDSVYRTKRGIKPKEKRQIVVCECCKGKNEGTYGSGRFCSPKCARGFASKDKRQEINTKVSLSLKGKPHPHKGVKRGFIDPEVGKKISTSLSKMYIEKRNKKSFNELGRNWKKRTLLEEANHRCQLCGQNEIWNEKSLVLQLNHIDGDNKNWTKENLRIICPNCHTQTETYCSKNMTIEEKEKHRLNSRRRSLA